MAVRAYYNEIDPKAASWLRELIKKKLIADGEVDERSITDVGPGDLKGFTQHHFFAGIGGWSYALRLAGWPDDKPVWTGSCPCQPFSAAGNNKGKKDDRHLWPHFFRLIRECEPDTVFGEQVEGAIKHGWLDDLQTDLEGEGYAVGHCVLGAHSVNVAHIRQRLYWVGHSNRNGHLTDKVGQSIEPGEVKSGVQQLEGSNPDIDWIYCRDNKHRPIKPGIKPLVDGLPKGMVYSGDPSESCNKTQEARVMRLKGYGNAIVPQVAAEFIRAFK